MVSDDWQGIHIDGVDLVIPIELALQDLSYPLAVLDIAVFLAISLWFAGDCGIQSTHSWSVYICYLWPTGSSTASVLTTFLS